jgi:hypothetical protein
VPICSGADGVNFLVMRIASCQSRCERDEGSDDGGGLLNVLVVAGPAAEEVAEYIVFAAEAVGPITLFEAAHTSDSFFDPAMVLFKSIIQTDARSRDFGIALVSFVLLTVWRAPPLLVVIISALGGIALAEVG